MNKTFIGEYKLGPMIGSGNFSRVYKAFDPQGRVWAIKIIDKKYLAKEHMENQILREIAIMRKLRHRNVVELRDALESTNHYYLVLEYVTGGELFDKIVGAKRFDENTARRYFHQLMAGIYYCHANGCAHRDLKPENLLLDASDTLKIMDFGLCNMQQDILLQTVCGTPNYVAPEVLMERGYNGLSADIWSCGIILYVMLAGRLPFVNKHISVLMALIERGKYPPLLHVSSSARNLVDSILVVDPSKRLSVVQIINHPWFQVGWNPKMLGV